MDGTYMVVGKKHIGIEVVPCGVEALIGAAGFIHHPAVCVNEVGEVVRTFALGIHEKGKFSRLFDAVMGNVGELIRGGPQHTGAVEAVIGVSRRSVIADPGGGKNS